MEAGEKKRISMVLGIVAGTLLALLATGVARAQDVTEEFHQSYPLTQNGSVRVKNVNGFIKITSWDQNQVKVDAVKRAVSKQRLDEAKIVVEPEAGSIDIHTQYPDDSGCHGDSDCHGHQLATVDYTISVPRGARLETVNAVNGYVDISGVAGPVRVNAVNGKVTVNGVAAESDVSSVNGPVETTFAKLDGSSRVHAVNGRVTLTLPSDASVRVRAHSLNGSISNDFGLPEGKTGFIGHELDGKIGDGAANIDVSTVNGRIEVRHANDGKPVAQATNLLPKQRTMAPY